MDEGEDLQVTPLRFAHLIDTTVEQMHELALLVWETEWMIKASAQLTLALRYAALDGPDLTRLVYRNSGGGNVRFGVAEELHAKD